MKSTRTRQQSTSTRRQQILAAALQCFLREGVEATTIEQIREASGASLGSIYHHFGSKEAIALAVYAAAIEEFHAAMLAPLRRQKTARGGVRALVAGQLAWMQTNADRARYLWCVETSRMSGPMADHVAELLRRYFQAIYEWLQPFIESGEIVRLTPALYVPLILGPASSVARHWVANRLPLNLPEVIDTLAEAAWNSIRIPRPTTRPVPRR